MLFSLQYVTSLLTKGLLDTTGLSLSSQLLKGYDRFSLERIIVAGVENSKCTLVLQFPLFNLLMSMRHQRTIWITSTCQKQVFFPVWYLQ